MGGGKAPEMNTFIAGMEVDGHTLVKKLGQGSSGYVWLGRDDAGGQEVVIKVIPLEGWRKEEFEREANAMSRLHHPNVLKMYKQFQQDATGILVLEKLDSDLLDFLDEYTVDESEARMMFRQILAGVHHLHKNCFAHMDIKPENILIKGSDRLVVADLGSTFQWAEGKSAWKSGRAGTSFYCAPEVKSGRPYLADKSDVWSLGITLHVIMTGFWPYLGQTEKEVLQNAKKGKINLAEQYLTPTLQALLHLMLKLEPSERPSIEDLLKHDWFCSDKESHMLFTPRSSSITSPRMSATSFSTNKSDPVEGDLSLNGSSALLPEINLEGLKTPRQLQMFSPRMGNIPAESSLDDGLIRPSPRRVNPGGAAQKQTTLSKILHNIRKKGLLPGRGK